MGQQYQGTGTNARTERRAMSPMVRQHKEAHRMARLRKEQSAEDQKRELRKERRDFILSVLVILGVAVNAYIVYMLLWTITG